MPELPEIETIKRSFQPLNGQPLAAIRIYRPDMIRQEEFAPELLQNDCWEDVLRRGKYLCFLFAEKKRWMTVHLGMSGRFFQADSLPEEKHIHMVIELKNGLYLIFQDPRRFGGFWFTLGLPEPLVKMGPEPLEEEFTWQYLQKKLLNRKTAIKNLLLNQALVAGIGNIYADEALFIAGVFPERKAESLSQTEIKRLHRAVIQVLEESIAARGTTFRDYRDGLNQAGSFQQRLLVYGREGEACRICGQKIESIRLGGRSTHFCSNCQK